MSCRLCCSRENDALVSYDSLPVAGCYVTPNDLGEDPCRPFSVLRCQDCGLVQLGQALDASFYADYRFVGDVSSGYKAHMDRVAGWVHEVVGDGKLVIEVGASNGALLEEVQRLGCRAAGFEPALEPARRAQAKGLQVVAEALTVNTAAQRGGQADAIVIRHVMEHIDDLHGFMEAVTVLSHKTTTLVVEVPDLASTVRSNLHSNFYHPHLCYFDEYTLGRLLKEHGWTVQGSSIVDIFGGSLLMVATRSEDAASLPALPGKPTEALLTGELESFFAGRAANADALRNFLDACAEQGLVVDGYGAAERTIAAIGAAGIEHHHLRRLYDRNSLLWGWSVPGCRVPIAPAEDMYVDPPDLVVVFAVSHEDEIIQEQSAYLESGGRFVSLRAGAPRVLCSGEARESRESA